MKWTAGRSETARGSSASEPRHWPATNPTRTGLVDGAEREGARSEEYTVTFKEPGSGENYQCTFPEAKWASFGKGQRYQGEIRKLTGSLDCGSLTAAK